MQQPLSPTGRTFEIVFDGGSINNPGLGYGSYIVSEDGVELHARDREEFGNPITNNQAEYLALTRALTWLSQELDPDELANASVIIRGDSQLVLNQLKGTWKVKNAGLRSYFDAARQLLGKFGNVELRWHDRSNSVKLLGH